MKKTKSKLKKEMKKAAQKGQFGKLIIFALLLLALYIYNANTQDPSATVYENGTLDAAKTMAVHFIDVGQADAAYIVLPDGASMLIDAGENASEDALAAYFDRYDINTLDYAVFTHPHEDHIGGADVVFDLCTVKNVILPDAEATSSTYEKMLSCIADSGAKVMLAEVGDTYTLGAASFEILGPVSPSSDDLNNASILLRLTYGDTSFLFTGDAEAKAEAAALSAVGTTKLNADVLKVGHHGSNTSSSDAFLEAVTPSVAVISCGENNDYGHPHDAILQRLALYTQHIFRTDLLGSVRVFSDGTALLVQSDRSGE